MGEAKQRKSALNVAGRCPQCGVAIYREHEQGCSVARCLHDGRQRLLHEMAAGTPTMTEVNGEFRWRVAKDGHDCGKDIWTGLWPGVAECEEYGLFCYFGPDFGEQGWQRCGPDHPGAQHDFTQLYIHGQWDRETRRWRIPQLSEVVIPLADPGRVREIARAAGIIEETT
jgi:hypothetical protein